MLLDTLLQPVRQTLPGTLTVWTALLIGLTSLVGCASISSDSNHQVIRVRSNPPGAKIWIDGYDAGEAPRLVLIDRKREPSFDLELGKERKHVDLETKYRWGASFWRNFVFLTYAPIGWLVDVATGAAWQAQDPAVIQFKNAGTTSRPRSESSPRTLAIAPPLADSLQLSDTGGEALERELKGSAVQVKPYQDTLSTFIANDYDFDGRTEDDDERKYLAYRLGTDLIFESKIEPRDGQLLLTGESRNVLTGETTSPTRLTLKPDGQLEEFYLSRGFFQFLPNTVGLDLVSEKLAWTQGSETIELVPAKNEEWWAEGLRFISAISITNLPPRRPGRSARGVVNFVPTFRFSRRRVTATGAPDVEDQDYLRWWISAGYGLEAGWQYSRHYLYLDLIPQLYWNQIKWSKNDKDFSSTGTGLNFMSEIGYLFFIDSNWNARIFIRSASEDTDAWKEALSRTTSDSQSGSAGLQTAGISIAYRFEPAIRGHGWSSGFKSQHKRAAPISH